MLDGKDDGGGDGDDSSDNTNGRDCSEERTENQGSGI